MLGHINPIEIQLIPWNNAGAVRILLVQHSHWLVDGAGAQAHTEKTVNDYD